MSIEGQLYLQQKAMEEKKRAAYLYLGMYKEPMIINLGGSLKYNALYQSLVAKRQRIYLA